MVVIHMPRVHLELTGTLHASSYLPCPVVRPACVSVFWCCRRWHCYGGWWVMMRHTCHMHFRRAARARGSLRVAVLAYAELLSRRVCVGMGDGAVALRALSACL